MNSSVLISPSGSALFRKNIMPVFSLMADSNSLRFSTVTILAPHSSIWCSYPERCDFCWITSKRIPSRFGRRWSLAGSPCDRQAAVPTEMAEAAPQVTIAAGACSSSARRIPTLFSSSGSGMKKRDASSIARMTSGGIIEPPRTVTTPTPLITGLIPRLAYKDDGEIAVTVVLAADRAAAGDKAVV